MKNQIILLSALSLLALSSIHSASAADVAAGKEKSVMCLACHGPDGNGTDPQYPRLAGQHRDYLAKALHDYQSGERKNPIMAGMVAALNNDDIENLAAYYASMSGLNDLSTYK